MAKQLEKQLEFDFTNDVRIEKGAGLTRSEGILLAGGAIGWIAFTRSLLLGALYVAGNYQKVQDSINNYIEYLNTVF